jgi:hypothetical protein
MAHRRSLPFAVLLALCTASGVMIAAPAAWAHGGGGREWRPQPVAVPAVSVSLQSEDGHGLTTVRHRGQTFVAGERGERYELVVTNNTAGRVEVVVSVDGRDVVSGKLADFTKNRGYVLEPFGSVVIDGFRTSLEQVAAFRFSGVGESYTGRLGTPQHAGVIGVAVFHERAHHRLADGTLAAPGAAESGSGGHRGDASKSKGSKDAKAPSASRSHAAPTHEQSNELGTEFGEQRFSAVREVSFIRASQRRPDFTTKIRYDSARGLAARGVPIEPEPVIVHHHGEPDAWPGASSDDRFADPPPPRRRRR